MGKSDCGKLDLSCLKCECKPYRGSVEKTTFIGVRTEEERLWAIRNFIRKPNIHYEFIIVDDDTVIQMLTQSKLILQNPIKNETK